MKTYQFPGDDLPVIRVSALGALNGEPQWEKTVEELMDAVDNYIPMPERVIDKPFIMPIEDIFSIQGRGTVVTGRIERGSARSAKPWRSWASGRRAPPNGSDGRGNVQEAARPGDGDNVGCCCAVEKEEVERAGRAIAKLA